MDTEKNFFTRLLGAINNALDKAASPPPQQAMAAQRTLQAELFNVRDYASRAVQNLSGRFNLDTAVSMSSLQAWKTADGGYCIRLDKTIRDKAVRHAEGVQIMQALNTSLSDVRFQTEKDVESGRSATYAAICDLEIQNRSCPDADCGYKVQRLRQNYGEYLARRCHLLLGLQATDIQDFPGYVVVTLRCDPSVRIDTRLP